MRLTTLPEGWTVFVNSLRQVQCSHVKTGMLCFQIPENPEVLNNLVFKGVPATGDRIDRKRKDRGQPEPRKHKSERHDDHQRSSQYMDNITSCSPVCWTDPSFVQNDQRRPTKTTTSENLPSKDVAELKQAALWHGDTEYVSQANDASVEGIMTLLRWSRSRF